MTSEIEQEKILKGGVFKKELEKLSTLALDLAGIKTDYTDEQLSDATLVFVEVFFSKIFDFHNGKFSDDQMMQLATEAGISLRQTILLFSGVDTRKIYHD